MEKVFLTEHIHPDAVEYLRENFEVVQGTSTESGEIIRQAQGCSAILIRSAKITAEIMDAIPTLKVVAKHGMGVDNIAVDHATEKGIRGQNVHLKAGELLHHQPGDLAHADDAHRGALQLDGLVGVALFELATDPYVKQADVEGLGITMATPEELYAKSDFVIVHTSLFPSTFHLVGAEQFKAMKNTAFIINAARGAVIDEAAMIEALKSGEIAGAGLDVFEQEPPADDNPLFSMENVIVSPHNAALSDGALRAMAMDSAQGITEYLTGKPVTYPVNKEVLK